MAVRPITLTREAHETRLRLFVTARRWESARPVIGKALTRRRTRVSELRASRQVRTGELLTLHGTDLPLHGWHRHRVRIRARGR